MKVLIAYTTKKGSTREVAEKIGKVLESEGIEVQLSDLKDKPEPDGYDATIIGAPVIMGNILHRAPRFVKKHLKTLEQKPFACFALGGMLAEDTSDNREKMLVILSKITGLIKPAAIGLFGGKYDDDRDYRNWDKISSWADELVEKIQ
ncbi:hypothetical protein GF359_00940 [candidate division WOR-3 bacterium]|uniref:Flavodoxin-like domain-containing protein n=1 Tax=candidate division WOR-3 bacterium TaxID=2052148 RepID=A0A9D5K801_UNCW3|nr:hypothetical protein [candidate division WOR-3 bacterium]MBD3363759.1 hypothetical protein [candidate division WOR-3 bacterium]